MNTNRPIPRYIIINMAKVKDKERILKAAREKQRVIYKRILIRLSYHFSAEILQDKRERYDILKEERQKPAIYNTLSKKIII